MIFVKTEVTVMIGTRLCYLVITSVDGVNFRTVLRWPVNDALWKEAVIRSIAIEFSKNTNLLDWRF